MLQIEITDNEGKTKLLQVPDDCIIGKGVGCDIRLSGWLIGKEHAHIFVTPNGILLEDMGAFGGVQVNGERIDAQYGPLKDSDIVGIGSYKLRAMEIGKASGIVQAASPRSRSDTAAVRNQQATEMMAESRRLAEETQERLLREQSSGTTKDENQTTAASFSSYAALSEKAKPSFAMILAPDTNKLEREFEWRKKFIHAY